MGVKFNLGDAVVLSERGKEVFPERYHNHDFTVERQYNKLGYYKIRSSVNKNPFLVTPSEIQHVILESRKKGTIEWV